MSEYILLPRRNILSSDPAARQALGAIPNTKSTAKRIAFTLPTQDSIEVIDSVEEAGPKLVDMSEAAANRLNDAGGALRAVPLVTYANPRARLASPTHATITTTFTVRCVDAVTGQPIPGYRVVAFEDYANRYGDEGDTDVYGEVQLSIQGTTIEKLFVLGLHRFWGAYRANVAVHQGATIQLDIEPVDLGFVDAVRHYYGQSRYQRTTGVVVGVLDTGVGPHTDLNILGGRNTVTGQAATDWADVDDHGTHVAGLIGANGTPPTGLRGVCPGIGLRAYRVFASSSSGASNYAILKAMIFAASDGCDIINLSLGAATAPDPIVQEAVADARALGMLVVAAAGNDGRQAVNTPASISGATAVSAMGREGTFPPGSYFDADVLRPPHGLDPLEFIADFSNIGPQIALTGLGVGVLSTLPQNQFGPMSGTSMAAPVVAGCAASLLSQDVGVYQMPRDRARSDAMERLLQSSGVRRGFGFSYEGYGLPDPNLV